MSAAIAAEDLSKRYRIGELQRGYGTLRDSLAAARRRRPPRPGTHQHDEEIWALRDVSFEVAQGEVLGIDRAQRRGQVDAAQGAVADHDADRRVARRSAAASAACSRSAPASIPS